MIKNIFIFSVLILVVLMCSSCAPLTSKLNVMGAEDIISFTDKTAKGVDWIKSVTDFSMGVACVSGRVSKDICSTYDQVSKNTSIIISNASKAVENYKSTGTILSQDQVKLALEDLMRINFKLDKIYKTKPVDIKMEDVN